MPPPRFKRPPLNGEVTLHSFRNRERSTEAAIKNGELIEDLSDVANRLGLSSGAGTLPFCVVDDSEMVVLNKLINGGVYYVSGGTEEESEVHGSGDAGILDPDVPVAWAFDPRVLLHEPSSHRSPETPHRLIRAVEMLQQCPRAREMLPRELWGPSTRDQPSLKNRAVFVTPRLAEIEEVLSWHDRGVYTAFLEDGSQLQNLKSDVYCNEKTSSTAVRLSAAAMIDASDAVLQSISQCRAGCSASSPLAAMCLVRPPGHHCTSSQPSGFCLINNVAVACHQILKRKYSLDGEAPRAPKIVIIDLDVHFGEGTAEFVEHTCSSSQPESPPIIYMSLHRYDQGAFYPADARGATTYRGTCVPRCIFNAAIDTHAADPDLCEEVISDYLFNDVVKHSFIPLLDGFRPDLVVVSQGFDAAYGDPLGRMAVEGGFASTIALLKHWCFKEPSHPVAGLVVALEGGYNPESVSQGVLSTAYALTFPDNDADVEAACQCRIPRTWADVRHKVQRQRVEQQQLQKEATSEGSAAASGRNVDRLQNIEVPNDDELMQRHLRWCRALSEQVRGEHQKAVQ